MPRPTLQVRIFATLVLCAAAAGVRADAPPPPPVPPGAIVSGPTLGLKSDDTLRFTVSAMVNGQGPYRFLIDTGADRSGISSRVAAALKLPAGDPLKVVSMSGVNIVPSVNIDTLEILPDVAIHGLNAPVFAAEDLGADGVLGVDSLQGQQVVIDFARHTMTVRTAKKHERALPEDVGAIIVVARSKFGQLILVDASLADTPLRVVLDTGGEYAVGNSRLRALASREGRASEFQSVQLLSVVGRSITADYTQIGKIKLGGFNILHTPIAFADVRPFERFGLTRQPSILLGMDVLRLFRRVTIDFANRRVSFVPPPDMARE